MATYTELRDLFDNDVMKNKVDVAVCIAASNLLSGTPSTAEQNWAAKVFGSPRIESEKAFRAVLATNRNSSVAQITGASDSTLQTAVNAVVAALVIANGVE